MDKKRFFFWLLLPLAIVSRVHAGEMPVIDRQVTTEFGVYDPVAVEIAPAVADLTLAEDFSNVAFFESMKPAFDTQALELLARNHFVALPGRFKQVHDLYNWAKSEDLPVFVTTDAMLHTFHILYDYALRILETERFQYDLRSLNEALLEMVQQRSSTDEKLAEELRRLVAFVSTARKLADPDSDIPGGVTDLVQAELALIEAHQGPDYSPIMGYREDFSQYVPRGHYTRSEALKRYFRAMMWYGRIGFRLRPGETEELVEKGRSETRMALNLVSELAGLEVNGEPALEVWERIYRPTVFFVGSADDLTAAEYADLAEEVYGKAPELLSPEQIAESENLETFISKAMLLRPPRINSSLLFDTEDPSVVTKGFRFMGQRFIPDSYVMGRLVHPYVLGRLFPRGLDVMAVLGSQTADRLLEETYSESSTYPDYQAALDSLKTEFAALPVDTWAENLYWNWLYCLRPLFSEKTEGYPSFMRNQAWRHKELGTALGSWAQLRHDTILYAKQSYTFETSIPVPQEFRAGYVEPEPHVFARLAALARYMRRGLDSRDVLPKEISWRLVKFESLALSLKMIAEKELAFESLSPEDGKVINTIGNALEKLVAFPGANEWENEADDKMAVIADVHTDPNTLQALEVGVGYPLALYVIVPTPSGPVITIGGMFSYYEFKHPLSDRLTDEAWQDMLVSGQPPLPAEWLDEFFYNGAQGSSIQVESYPSNFSSINVLRLQFSATSITSGEEFEVRLESYIGWGLGVSFWAGDKLLTEVELIPDPEEEGFLWAPVSTTGWPAGRVRADFEGDGLEVGSSFIKITPAINVADLNRSGQVDVMDLIELIRLLAQGDGKDVNNDGKSDLFDLIHMLRILSGVEEIDTGPSVRLAALGGCGTSGERSPSEEKDGLKLELDGNILSFTHSAATYNCCMDSLTLSIGLIGDNLIRVIETEHTLEPCRCICDYTVFGEITNLGPGNYRIEVVSANDTTGALCSAEITVP
ncbi:MAG TPA: DUF3160 domain-containing protein [archaeon]|nr:DUF3160 domain-containing protein [archaeon]